MASQAVQRLIAAGASPARAKSFSSAVTNKVPTGLGGPQLGGLPELGPMPSVASIKAPEVAGLGIGVASRVAPKKGPTTWYTDDYAAGSSQFRTEQGMPGWELPKFGSPDIGNYFDKSYGPGTYKKVETQAYIERAPDLFASSKSKGYDKAIYKLVLGGASLPQVLTKIVNDGNVGNPGLEAFPVTDASGDVVKAAGEYATRLFNQYAKLQSGFDSYVAKLSPRYSDYRYDIPSTKTKYGVANNFKEGTIDVLNNYWALQNYKAREQKLTKEGKKPEVIKADLLKYKKALATRVNGAGRTPAKDEQARRDALKKASK
jgi:hypothetical protein